MTVNTTFRRVTIIPLNKITPNPLKPNQLNRAASIAQRMNGSASCAIELVSVASGVS